MEGMVSTKEKKFLLFLFCILLFFPFLAQEFSSPHWTLILEAAVSPKPGPLVARMSDGIEARIYAATKPFIGRIARLQKGLVLQYRKHNLTGEGYGLGVPILHKNGVPWMASRAKIGRFTRGDTVILAKVFYYDMIETESELPRLRYRKQRRVLTTVRVNYYIYRNRVDIQADFRRAKRAKIDEVFLMNEVAGDLFQYALTQNHRRLELLGWQMAPAGMVALYAPALDMSVWVQSNPVWDRFLGREVTSSWKWYGRLKSNWTGCAIHLPKPPAVFSYTIYLKVGSQSTN